MAESQALLDTVAAATPLFKSQTVRVKKEKPPRAPGEPEPEEAEPEDEDLPVLTIPEYEQEAKDEDEAFQLRKVELKKRPPPSDDNPLGGVPR